MSTALIGYTGFVGGSLNKQNQFDDLYRSSNINQIENKHYDLIVCAGAPGQKWKANQHPSDDYQSICKLISQLKTVSCKKFILISTVDVYNRPINVFETTDINASQLNPYGLHRYLLEKFIHENFENHFIIRLPGLFGEGLKKNFIFDLINEKDSRWTDSRSYYQFYNLDNLWMDIIKILPFDIKLMNFATPPISAAEIAKNCFQIDFNNHTENGPVFYNMLSGYGPLLGNEGPYIINRISVLKQISDFINSQGE